MQHTHLLSICMLKSLNNRFTIILRHQLKAHKFFTLHEMTTVAMMGVIGGENNHAEIAAMIERLMIPSMKSEVMSTAAKWLDEEQASEWPRQKQGWQPSGLTGCRLKNPGLHLFVTLQDLNTTDILRRWNKEKKRKKEMHLHHIRLAWANWYQHPFKQVR